MRSGAQTGARRHGVAAPAPAAPAPAGLALAGLRRRVSLVGADAVGTALAELIPTWRMGPADPPVQAHSPETHVTGGSRGYRFESDYLDGPMRGLPLASAVCAVVADLAQAWADERPDHMALHAGALRSGLGGVVLAGPARAGKSTLVARLGAEPGWQVLCDDVLPVAPGGQGVALGIPPRLRLPVPDAAGTVVQAMAVDRCVLRDDRYGYVVPPDLARHGSRVQLRVLVVLDRRAEAAPRLHVLPGPEAVRLLADQTIAGAGMARLVRLAARMTCLRLVYSGIEPAAALLARVLASARTLAAADLAAPLPPAVPTPAAPMTGAQMAGLWQRRADLVPRRLRDGLVLWAPDHGRGLALNPTGAAVWHLLREPVQGNAVAALLARAFDQVAPDRIAADVAGLMGALLAEDLVVPVPPAGG